MSIIENYIAGDLIPANSKSVLPNIDPSRGEPYGTIPDSDASDVELAYAAAHEAFPAWSTLPASKRSWWLMRIADAIESQLDSLAEAESQDNGKPIWLAKKVDIPRAVENFRFFSTAILQEESKAYDYEGRALNYVYRAPVGVVGCISPWNLPLYLFTWKIAPALAAGCTVVAKPSEVTPMTAFLLSKICKEVGLPAGVLNLVHGTGPSAGQAIVSHPGITAISFTGGTVTGQKILATAGPMMKKLSLELGGKNAAIVFADCDWEETIKGVVTASFSNQGQICLCSSRILVERSVYERFVTEFVERVKKMTVGHPTDPETKVGALVSKAQLDKVLSYVALAKEEGGTIVHGGNQVHLPEPYNNGYYITPTVVTGLPMDCRVNQEEIFGPLVTIMPFDTDEEALALANHSKYGLSATIWTSHLQRAHRFSQQLEVGIVWVNCWLVRDLRTPFGGMKQSGIGREGGFEALHFFTEPKNICIQL